MSIVIQTEEIFHHFGSKAVLRGVSLSVNAGEVVVIMGPNGMGKSTLLAAIGGGIPPRGGRVTISGHSRYTTPESEMEARRSIMYLPDAPWAPVARTARQWAVAVARLYRSDDAFILDHVDALIRVFELENVADSPIDSYSAGQKKKAGLIAALAPMTPGLVLDEPFSGGLDPTGLLAIKRLLQHRARHCGHAVLISTPTPELVEEVADRIIILRNGVIAGQGTLNELRHQSGTAGSLESVYELLSSSEVETRLADYRKRFGR